MNLMTIIWLIAAVVLGIIEATTVTLTCIWFAIGAVGAAIVALFGGAIWLQIIVFAVLSIVCILALRPIAKSKLGAKDKVATNADRIIGQEAIVKESIDNVAGTGAIAVAGLVWTARSEKDALIKEGSRVKVIRIDGVKAIVAPL